MQSVNLVDSRLIRGSAESIIRPFAILRSRAQDYYEYFVLGPVPVVDGRAYPGDPGWQSPGGVSWKLFSDPASVIAVFASMLMQSAHPVIADAFQRFGSYEEHPEHRFWLTGGFYFATTFGSTVEAESWVRRARQGHRGIRGRDGENNDISVSRPDVLLFSHLCVLYSTIAAWEKYGPSPRKLSTEEKDSFCREQAWAAIAIGARDVPLSYAEVLARLDDYMFDLSPDASGRAALDSVLSGRGLPKHARTIYRMIVDAAIATLPQKHKDLWQIQSHPAHMVAGLVFTESVRNVLPELSCVSAAKQRLNLQDSFSIFDAPAVRPLFLFPSGLAEGEVALSEIWNRTYRDEAKVALRRWWSAREDSTNESDICVSPGTFEQMALSGLVLEDGVVTRRGGYAAGATMLDTGSLEEVARTASNSSRPSAVIRQLN